ncbi:PHD finger protein 12-like isoform X2 [Scleropages formosus]|uniref:PHD finger protein 12-like isoform X2 n=1 Tax=Scleropages formosus TaxID=113540 RepID=UPI0010FA8BA9|nr:PHD finger protein 12-like isoform X2 [Scleropages formosus]
MWDTMESASAGLVEIQSLLAPPRAAAQGEEEEEEEEDEEQQRQQQGARGSRRSDTRPRRSGRIAARESCASCGEGGDLLSCDRCPAAFHLRCCNPPLSEEMLPPGDWMCHRCVARRKKREQRKDQINGLLECRMVKQLSPPVAELGAVRLEGAGLQAVAQVRFLERPGTPASSTSTDTATPSEPNDADEEDLLDAEDEAPGSDPDADADGPGSHLRRPFELLIAAAMERNPTQFQLPGSFTCTTSLPGTTKRRRKEEATGRNVKRKKRELDPNGLDPLPVKVCFSCGRGCRLAPLIQCDLCPLLFHMDCVDPPMTAMPTSSWRCPNHKEHVSLSKADSTQSSRCQLFDHFQDMVSQNAIKLDFLQRAYQRRPSDLGRVQPHRTRVLKVPDAVKCQYKCPSALNAPMGVRSGELICNSVDETTQLSSPRCTSKAEQREWLQDIVALQCSIVQHLSAKQITPLVSDCHQVSRTNVKPCVDPQETGSLCPPEGAASAISYPKPCHTPASPQGASLLNSLSHSEEPERSCCSPVETSCLPSGSPNRPLGCSRDPDVRHPQELQQRLASPASSLVKMENEAAGTPCLARGQTCVLSSRSVSSPTVATCTLAPPRATQDSSTSAKPRSSTCAAGRIGSCVKAVVDGDGDVELSQLDERFVRLLAWQRIQQLFHNKGSPALDGCARVPSTPQAAVQRSQVRARAAFYPLTGKGGAVNMCYRTLYIGTGADMDVCLTNYGHCNYVSGKHACIFYDENTKHYELLNYSEHGTMVDNVLYSCDFSEKTSPGHSSSVVTKVQNIIRRCREQEVELEAGGAMSTGTEPAKPRGVTSGWPQSGLQGSPWTPCNCKASGSSRLFDGGAGWEGTALLHHGSCVKVGCLQFVFSVVEFAPKPPGKDGRNRETRDTAESLELHQPPALLSGNSFQ